LALDRYEELLTEAIAKPAQVMQKKLALRNWDCRCESTSLGSDLSVG
jgi:hypothetical protein